MWRKAGILSGAFAGVGIVTVPFIKKYNNRGSIEKNVVYKYSYPPTRNQMIQNMKNQKFDVLIVGGGATGAGVVLDCASRGLKAALIEMSDFASGTSSRSTKLIHGGIRYLEAALKKLDKEQLGLVAEGLRERSHALAAAPHLSSPLPLLMPLFKWIDVISFYFGIKIYDLIGKFVCGFNSGVPASFWMRKDNAKFFLPLLRSKNLKGAMVYYDGQWNDSRVCLDLILTSCIPDYIKGFTPASAANYCRLLSVKHLDHSIEAEIEDTLTGEKFTVEAKALMNCGGPFTDMVRDKLEGSDTDKLVQVASGIHVMLPDIYNSNPFGMIIPKTSDGRVVFFVPWERNTLAGTTDDPAEITELPRATHSEVEFVINEACQYLNLQPENLKDKVTAAWSGLRPLVKDPSNKSAGTKELVRSHLILLGKGGVISVMGGKWTAYRQMAEDAVNKLIEVHGSKFRARNKTRTRFMLVSGAVDHTNNFSTDDLKSGGRLAFYLMDRYPLSPDQAKHLVHNYGFRALEICEMANERKYLFDSLFPSHREFIKAEVLWATKHEMAMTVADVLARRMRIAFIDNKAATEGIDQVLEIMKNEYQWNEEQEKYMRRDAEQFISTMKANDV